MPRNKKSLAEAVSAELKSGFNLDSFKNKKGLANNVKFIYRSFSIFFR